ncbi:hypothetical protein N1851_005224 [Merluccius polli]|uniref:THAP-type domain-containing protein n=1 Tax=Merluccius polli TaxID=89951 RepID=A0AA47N7H3_MERPO|nr:hypothetical protein N1851_005224 [Merluccius polli]
MPDSCCSIGCANRRGDRPGLCLYRIPSEKENPERRLWICAIRRADVLGQNEFAKECAKSDDPLSPDWVPSIFPHTPATKKRKKEHDMERYQQHRRMQRRVDQQKKQDAVDVLLNLTSVPEAEPSPPAEDELQQCENKSCKAMIESLQRECNGLREENFRLKDI